MGEYKTPGVYIKEKNAFGNSVVEAETAIPAFIGYTETTQNGAKINNPQKISSMTEFVKYFGGAPKLDFKVSIVGDQLTLTEDSVYTLYYNMMLFFANGGGACYIVSVGGYDAKVIDCKALSDALDKLKLAQEITMVVIPEAVNSANISDFNDLQKAMLEHCGNVMKNRIALLDIYPKAKETTTINDQVDVFKNGVGSNYLSYGAAYFPWLNTSVLGDRDLVGNFFNWDSSVCNYIDKILTDANFVSVIKKYFGKEEEIELKNGKSKKLSNGTEVKFEDPFPLGVIMKDDDKNPPNKIRDYEITQYEEEKKEDEIVSKKMTILCLSVTNLQDKNEFYLALSNLSPLFKQAIKAILSKLNLLPPSAAMAGIYTMVDNTRGVWKAPANVSLNYVNSPSVDIDDDEQADLNAPVDGKAVNVIRTFRGEGVKVWGARTLDGNSLDWRYVNVRRTLLFLEESVKNAARAYVFEPNDASTWINMKCMIESFLRSIWKRGGLAGATPEDAFEVHVGLGDTMTGEDILEGIMRISVLVAVSHPAEFIEITFQQQMQKS